MNRGFVVSAMLILLLMVVAGGTVYALSKGSSEAVSGGQIAASTSVSPSERSAPGLVNFQGLLKDSQGNAISSSVQVAFLLYVSPTGGAPLWQESQNVTAQDGLFNTLLGSVTPLTPATFQGGERWLGIKVGSDAEMTPRLLISSVPYSLVSATSALAANADTLDTLDSTDFSSTGDLESHAGLSGAHHTKYADSEAVAARGTKGNTNPLNHDRYADGAAVSAVLAADGSGSGLDADKLDGLDARRLRPGGAQAEGAIAGALADALGIYLSPYTVTSVDTGSTVGYYTSIAIGVDGLPIISYQDQSKADLKVAHCEDVACTSATISTVNSAGFVGRYSSIAIGRTASLS